MVVERIEMSRHYYLHGGVNSDSHRTEASGKASNMVCGNPGVPLLTLTVTFCPEGLRVYPILLTRQMPQNPRKFCIF